MATVTGLLHRLQTVRGICTLYAERKPTIAEALQQDPAWLYERLSMILRLVGEETLRRYQVMLLRASDFEPLSENVDILVQYADRVCEATIAGLLEDLRLRKVADALSVVVAALPVGSPLRTANIDAIAEMAVAQNLDKADPLQLLEYYWSIADR